MSDTIKKHVKDPGSAITHFIGMLMAVFAAVPLIIKATHEPSPIYVVSIAIYAAGGIIYALKLPIFNMKHKDFGSHEIFHLFVMGGSICHFVVMYAFVL